MAYSVRRLFTEDVEMHIETAKVLAHIAEATHTLDSFLDTDKSDAVLEEEGQKALTFLSHIFMLYMEEGVSMENYYLRGLRALYPSFSKKNLSEVASLLDRAVLSQPLFSEEGNLITINAILFEYGDEIADALRAHMQTNGFSFFVKMEDL